MLSDAQMIQVITAIAAAAPGIISSWLLYKAECKYHTETDKRKRQEQISDRKRELRRNAMTRLAALLEMMVDVNRLDELKQQADKDAVTIGGALMTEFSRHIYRYHLSLCHEFYSVVSEIEPGNEGSSPYWIVREMFEEEAYYLSDLMAAECNEDCDTDDKINGEIDGKINEKCPFCGKQVLRYHDCNCGKTLRNRLVYKSNKLIEQYTGVPVNIWKAAKAANKQPKS